MLIKIEKCAFPILMITSNQFNSHIHQFQQVLETYIESPQPLKLLNSHIIEQNDQKVLKLSLQSNGYILVLIFSFDQFYQVPVMNFQVHKEDFGPEQDELVQIFDLESTGLVKSPQFVTVDNHPLLPGTYFMIHPCETQQTIATLIKDSDILKPPGIEPESTRVLKYLVTWNVVYGTGIFTHLYLKYNMN